MTPPVSVRQEQMVARTRLVDDDAALVAVRSAQGFRWWHDGRGLVTDGVAKRVPAACVHEVLATIDVDDNHQVWGTGPIAVGALTFDPTTTREAEMVVPSRNWTRDADGHTWLTEISGDDDVAEPLRSEARAMATGAMTQSDMSEDQWARAVGEALEHIKAGELDKVVLARQVTVTSDTELFAGDIVQRLVSAHPSCYVFCTDGFVGASPELLVERRGDMVRSRPMAGTVPRNDEAALAWLEASAKNGREHALVVDAVVTRLTQLCDQPPHVSDPQSEPFADLAHIVTNVVGRLSSPVPSALDLALELHPTPAVAGTPVGTALSLISALEMWPRGRYAGPVGWVDACGDGEFAVALRCAQVHAKRAVLYTGAGIVAGSTCEDEWRETESKLAPMLRALAPV